MFHMECVYATFSSYCAKSSRVMCCLFKRGEKTYVFTVPFVMETTLTNEVPDVASETMVSDTFGRVFSSVEHAYQYRKALDVDCGLCDRH